MKHCWHILGAGAIGNLWACHLTELDFPVSLILKSEQQLEKFPNYISLDKNKYKVNAELATTSSNIIEQLLICTKAMDTEQAFNAIRQRISPSARVIVLQNGIGSQQWVSKQLPDAQLVWASTLDGVWLKKSFHIIHAGKGITSIGAPNCYYPWLTELQSGLLQVEIDSNIFNTLWKKLAINSVINPLTAWYGCKNGELLRNQSYLYEMQMLCNEVEQVAKLLQIRLFDTTVFKKVQDIAKKPQRITHQCCKIYSKANQLKLTILTVTYARRLSL